MSYVVLARKWRPQTFSDLVGQGHVSQTLGNAIANNRVAHAFLFTGVRGVGKTTSARILAKALNCMSSGGPTATPCLTCAACKEITDGRDVDVQEIDGASYTGVDEVRRLQESMPYSPNRDRYKIYIVDEVHMLSQSAWNAFLKTLEEPPEHVKFIFATTEVHKVPVTILSRVQRFDFKLIPTKLIVERLAYVLENETVAADAAALSIIAREAAGSMRDAMSLLDQVIAWSDQNLTGEDVARVLGVASRKAIHDLAHALTLGDANQAVRLIADLANQGFEMSNVARDVLSLLRDIVVCATCENSDELLDLPDEELANVRKLAEHSTEDLLRLHQGFSEGYDSVAVSPQPRAALEMLLVRLARRPPLVPIDDLIERLISLEQRLHGGRGGGGRASGSPAPGRAPSSTDRSPAGGASRSASALGPPASGQSRPTPNPPRQISGNVQPARTNGSPAKVERPGSTAIKPPASPSAPTDPHTTAQPTSSERAARDSDSTPSSNSGREPMPSNVAAPTRSITRTETVTQTETVSQADAVSQAEAGDPTVAVTPKSLPEAASAEPTIPSAGPVDPALRKPPAAAHTKTQHQPQSVESRFDSQSPVDRWRSVVDRIRTQDPKLGAFLDHAQVVELDREVVVVSYEQDSVFSSALNTQETQATIAAVMHQLLGSRPSVELRVGRSGNGSPTVFEEDRLAREQRRKDAIDQAKQHPAVTEAVKIFGARVRSVEFPEA